VTVTGRILLLFYTEIKSRDSGIESQRGAGHSRGIRSCWFVLLYFAPCRPLPRPRRPLPPSAAWSGVSYILQPSPAQQGPTPIFSAATAGGRTTLQTVSAAAKTLPTTPTR